MFAAAAVRLSQSIGLHKSNSFGLPASQIEEWKRVFWIAFILDADICQRTGRPAAQDTRDYSTLPPHENPPDGLGVMEIGQFHGQFLLSTRSICCHPTESLRCSIAPMHSIRLKNS
ncbi:hypothetical protein ACN38_g1942 [Penicillium nordicum]|uniref:Xylanolytic transcriptional activator regulatory domain-containing protein n=1 Tax=Penicillium nordicum TaxID=229535 RepID=A0A0M8P7U2_9EURO|nr:hypothetical protein ACN38_g1942 [Penicillium nordicum]